MNRFLLTLAFLLLSYAAQGEIHHFRWAQGKVMAYEWLGKAHGKKTLLLLPGVNRALSENDRSVQLLLAQGWNILMPSLPSHPASIAGLDKYEVPYFISRSQIRSQDLARDIESLVEELGLKKVIPVSLSYSSSLSAHLSAEKFPYIIDTVPLVVPTEADPRSAALAKQWEDMALLNPFVGPLWVRSFRDQAYYRHWSARVDENLKRDSAFYGDNPRVSDIKAGYVSIARAVEDFDFKKTVFDQNSQIRDFVFAGQEDPVRLQNQIAVLKNYLRSGKPTRVVVVQKAGHVLPTDMPAAYANILMYLSSNRPQEVRFLSVNSSSDIAHAEWGDRTALERWMKSVTP